MYCISNAYTIPPPPLWKAIKSFDPQKKCKWEAENSTLKSGNDKIPTINYQSENNKSSTLIKQEAIDLVTAL